MNEQNKDFQLPMELPKPQLEANRVHAEAGLPDRSSEQTSTQATEQGVSNNPLMPLAGNGTPYVPVPGVQPGSASQITNNTDDTAHLIADDVDLIEKEWVHKAKEIVEKTKSDPHTQNKKMNEVKADYLKKRYNRDLKPAED